MCKKNSLMALAMFCGKCMDDFKKANVTVTHKDKIEIHEYLEFDFSSRFPKDGNIKFIIHWDNYKVDQTLIKRLSLKKTYDVKDEITINEYNQLIIHCDDDIIIRVEQPMCMYA